MRAGTASRGSRGFKVLCVTIALTMAMAACGGSSGGGTESENESGSGTLRLGFSAWPGWFPWQVAQEKGLFGDLDVEPVYFESYTDSLNALNAGQIDANSQTLNDTIASATGGSKQVVVLVNDNSTGNDQVIARPGIESAADLKGKKVAVEEGTVDHFLLLLGLDKAGLTKDDIELQPLATDAAAAAFSADQVDAVGVFAPFTTTALELPGSKAIFTSSDFPGAIPDHLVFSADFVSSRPDDVQKLVDAWFATLDYIANNKVDATEIMAKRAGVSVEDYKSYEQGTRIFTIEDNLDAYTPGSDMSHLDFAAREIQKFVEEAGLTENADVLGGNLILDDRFVKKHAGH